MILWKRVDLKGCENIMDKELYYCSNWKHQFYKGYDVCVSDFVEHKGMIQIHGIAIKNGKVVRGFSTDDLREFEEKVRSYVRIFIDKGGTDGYYDARTVKIWYYNPDNRELSTDDIPLRFAITFFRPFNMDKEAQSMLKDQLLQTLFEQLEKFTNRG